MWAVYYRGGKKISLTRRRYVLLGCMRYILLDQKGNSTEFLERSSFYLCALSNRHVRES